MDGGAGVEFLHKGGLEFMQTHRVSGTLAFFNAVSGIVFTAYVLLLLGVPF
jgi:hypothetical protein